jgi:hypothetical protein
MALTEVPPPTVPTVNVVLGSDGVCRSEIFAIARARQSELLETVAAGARKNHFVAMAPSRLIDHRGDAKPVDRDEAVDVSMVAEQGFDAPEIAEFLFADGADEHHIAHRRDPVRIDRLDQRQQRGETARVVADARRQDNAVFLFHGNVSAFGKHRVEVRRHHQLRPAAAAALAQADHIAFGVDVSVP